MRHDPAHYSDPIPLFTHSLSFLLLEVSTCKLLGGSANTNIDKHYKLKLVADSDPAAETMAPTRRETLKTIPYVKF